MKISISKGLTFFLAGMLVLPAMTEAGNLKKVYIHVSKEDSPATVADLGNIAPLYGQIETKMKTVAYNFSGKGEMGTFYNTTLENGPFDEAGKAVDLKGNSYVLVNHSPTFDQVTNQVTVECWIQTHQSTGIYVPLSKYTEPGWELVMRDGKIGMDGRDGSTNYRSSSVSTTNIADGKWHHVVGIIDKSKWQIWVDGKLENQVDTGYTATTLKNTFPLVVGGQYGSYFVTAKIAEVRIWNTVRSEEQIKGTLHTSLKGNEPNLVGYWKFY